MVTTRPTLGESLEAYLALAAASSLAVLLGGLAIFVELQNAQAEKSERAMVEGGLAAFSDSAELFAMDYGWWNEGLSRVEQNDTPWLWENVGAPITTTNIFDLVA